MTKRVVLVTGASSGIGKASVELFAARGYYVFAAARRLPLLEKMRSASIEPIPLDVTSQASVDVAVAQIRARTGRLDVMVNNAGYAMYGILEEVGAEDALAQFDSNVFGLMRMTRAVLPVMREQRSGHIINISSVAGRLVTPAAGWYCASKAAVEALSDALRMEVAGFGIKVVVIEPGAIKSEFEDVALGNMVSSAGLEEYRVRREKFRQLVKNSYKKAPGPEVIARLVLKASQTERPYTRYTAPADAKMYL